MNPDRHGALLVAGTTSGAGKSTVTAALCRLLADRGRRVAPFKAQNMSNHAAVTRDGGEVGRAQAVQALAARVEIDRRLNPILLKPGSDHRSHVVVLGEETAVTDAVDYTDRARALRPAVLDAFASLRAEFDWVVAEGAGGAAEINLLDRDLVNLPLARAAGLPVLLVADIDRGGAFASVFGTITILPDELRDTIAGVVFNQFRGDSSLLERGIDELERRTGVPVLGVLPHLGEEPLFGVEDSLDLRQRSHQGARASEPLRVAAIQLPRLANPSDLDPLLGEPSVELWWTSDPSDVGRADMVVLPGSRATVDDLAWLRATGIADALASTTATIVGVCAGFQMLGQTIDDTIESRAGTVPGLGLLDTDTTFRAHKIVKQRRLDSNMGRVLGYEIRFGRPTVGARPWFTDDTGDEGAVDADGRVFGTSLHGLFDQDGFRRTFLGAVADRRHRCFRPAPDCFADQVDGQLDRLARWFDTYADADAITRLGAQAVPATEMPGW